MAKKAKKRGVKPGTKRGPYKKARAKVKTVKMIDDELGLRPNKIIDGLKEAAQWSAMNKRFIEATPASVGNLPSLISELTSTIDTLEVQLTAQIDRIKSILV